MNPIHKVFIGRYCILLLKPDFKAPYRSAAIVSIRGISRFYAAQFVTTAEKQQMVRFYNCLGQKVPSVCIPIPSCLAKSLITPMGTQGINFTGVTVLLNSNSENTLMQARKDQNRYHRRTKGLSKTEGQHLKKQCEDGEALKAIQQEVYPQCADCLYHFNSQSVLRLVHNMTLAQCCVSVSVNVALYCEQLTYDERQ